MTETTWTVAHRNPRANRIVRVAGPATTWTEARAMGDALLAARPDLEVWVSNTAETDHLQREEDRGNLMAESGRRIRVVEGSWPEGYAPAEPATEAPAPCTGQHRGNPCPAPVTETVDGRPWCARHIRQHGGRPPVIPECDHRTRACRACWPRP